jgi:hypothetical protein
MRQPKSIPGLVGAASEGRWPVILAVSVTSVIDVALECDAELTTVDVVD